MNFIVILSLAVIAAALIFLGRRLFKAFKNIFPGSSKAVFWVIFPVAVILIVFTHSALFGMIVFPMLFFPLLDIIKYFLKKINLPDKLRRFCKKVYMKGFLAIALSFIITGWSVVNAASPIEKSYEVDISGSLKRNYTVIYASDMHIGSAVNEKLIDDFVSNSNAKNPDIVCLGGDIFDESTPEYLFQYAMNAFSQLKTQYGTYYVYGNHEKMNDEAKIKESFEEIGITVLCDESILINNDFYLVGRLDKGQTFKGNAVRKPLSELLGGISDNRAIILLDHQPADLEEAERLGVDLQLSGHTHAGQIFPGNLLASMTNEYAYGHLIRNDYDLIVSSGYGTWGFPIRYGSRSEWLTVTLKAG